MNNIVISKEIAEEVAKILIDGNVYSIDFTKEKDQWTKLPDGTITPCYCNCRYINRSPVLSHAIINFLETLVRLKFKESELVVGLATAGIPFASLLAERLNLPISYVRSKPKEYGQGKLIECNPELGLKAVIVDDLLFTGASLIRAVDALKEEYCVKTVGIVTIVSLSSWDCDENEWEYFKKEKIQPYSLTSYEYLLNELLARKKITKEQHRELTSYYLRPKTYEWK